MKNLFFLLLGGSLLAGLSSCSTSLDLPMSAAQDVMMAESSSGLASYSDRAKGESKKTSAASRGVIGTSEGDWEWEEGVHQMRFDRLNKNKPASVMVLDYRDESKVYTGSMAKVDSLSDSAGLIKVRFIKEGAFWNSSFPLFLTQSSRPILLGEKDEPYVIEVVNNSDSSLEVVISIDGLNTADREKATYASRGCVIGAGEKAMIRGWLERGSGIRRFTFSDSDGSSAAWRSDQGTVPDIGTIGFAIFQSKTALDAGTRGRAFAN